MSTQPLVWWHLSDLHWDVQTSTERRTFLDVFYDDLRQRRKELGPPDFVVLSGDITFSGDEAQYLAAEKEFLTPVAEIAGNNCPFFFVPGNHDLRRTTARTVNTQLIASLNSTRSLDEFLDERDYVDMVQKPFSSYHGFAARMMPTSTPTASGWWTKLHHHGRTILIVGVNSSWASSYHKDHNGLIVDERHLLVGSQQILPLIEHAKQADLSLVITHHPLKWLNGFSEAPLRQHLQRHADFVLFGHTHDLHDILQTIGPTGATVFLPAPAIYDRAPTDTVQYARGYNVVTFDLETKQGAAHYFKYSDAYATKFDVFSELYAVSGQNFFPIDLSHAPSRQAADIEHRFQSLEEVLDAFSDLHALSNFIEACLDTSALERHAVEYFERIIMDLVRESEIIDQDAEHIFWECVVLTRGVLFLRFGAAQYLWIEALSLSSIGGRSV